MPTPTEASSTGLPQPAGRTARPLPPIEGRKPMAAGHVILVVLLALIIGTFLNAPGLYKTARNQRPGWQRNVAVVTMTPVKWISVHLGISLPREFLQEATGQAGADKINTFVPAPAADPSAGGLSPTTTTVKPVATPYNKMRVWVAGDSLAITPGQVFESQVDNQVTDLRGVDGRVSTGLARPDVFNWFAHIKSETARLNPQVVVLTFGANDDQSLVGGPGGKTVGPFGSEAWKTEYRRRVGGLMDQVTAEGRRVVWTGVPVVRNDERAARYAEMNAIYKDEAAKRPDQVYFLDTWPLLTDASGAYADDLVINGAPLRVRAPDGIHFTRLGGQIIADAQLRMINGFWDLVSGRNATTTVAPPTAPATTAVTPSSKPK